MSHWPSSSLPASEQSPIADSMVSEHDWTKSRIGHPSGWPAEWQTALRVCLASRRASFLALGHDLELVYNDPYAETFHDMHPWAFGRPLREAWAAVWEGHVESRLSRVLLRQRSFAAVDVTGVRGPRALSGAPRLLVSLSTLRGGRGASNGLFGTVVEARSEAVDEERLLSLHELVTRHVAKCSLEEAESACLHALARAPRKVGELLRRAAAQLATATTEATGEHEHEVPVVRRGRSRSEFISRLSFQLRTSLTPVLGEIEELLACDRLSAKELAQVRAAWRSARRLSALVDALLEFSRFEDGDVTPRVTATDLAQATRRLCGLVRTAFERAGIAFEVDCPPLPEPVAVDREMWEKVLSSLLSNALKFTVRGSVRVEQRVEGEWVVLTVSDTGSGIDEQTLPHIFDRFFSAPPPGVGAHDGGGIGLSLARELIRLHGGDIEVSSAAGRGSTFAVRIPYRNAPLGQVSEAGWTAGDAQPVMATPTPREPSAGLASYEDSRGDRILVVDDNEDTREYLQELLGSHWPVEIVCDGLRALARAREALPGLIVADLVMPGLDGLSLVRKLRRDPRTYQVPVVILSAQADEHTAIEGLHAGAVDYVVKPFSGKELVARIEGLLALSRERRGERAARESAEHELRLRDEFIATMSHELRAPLSAIVGWAEILRDEASPPERRAKALEVIERNARTQTRLIADLLDVSRIATGSFRMELETIRSIGPIVRAAIDALMPFAQQRGVLLDTSVDEPSGPLRGDSLRLQQVVWNLVSNALKFTPSGGHVHILCGNRDQSVLIRVADTGQGIAHEFLPHVFERFAQEPRLGSKHGLGLGLAIVQGILELHGGTISVESAGEGRGTTFTVRLPLLLKE